MTMEMLVKQRIKEIQKEFSLSTTALAKRIGMVQSTLSRQIDGDSALSVSVINAILHGFPNVSKNWLLFGEGEMMRQGNSALPLAPTTGQPYYDVDFMGGWLPTENDQTVVPYKMVNIPGIDKVELWCNISGHSMEPRIMSGAFIGLHATSVEAIMYGEVYAIVTTDGQRTVKVVRRSETPGKLLLVPVNPEYDKQEVTASSVLHIYEVVATVTRLG